MKNIFLLLFILGGVNLQAQSIFGKWHTINEETGKPNSIIEIYEEDGAAHGKVVRIIKEEDRDQLCNNCDGELKDQPIEGLELMKGFEKSGNEYVNGLITDPKTGKQYKSKIWIDETNPDRLKVRGYIAFFYKTQTWHRAQ
ncbi:DUF2147 domain-containing protein [Antarcticibacterium arcticum]|uniref:DUF2147 domain-containing protein n=2 Tax=Antarcticibacterium arcticum TaxID=2585771 RepID=A0A5B8YQQ5_9FLAO|nr:DUF2147 domain-containing protein [Antarcticibacterium arcticum]